MEKVDTTLFIKTHENDLIIIQIFVDDMIVGSSNELLCKKFSETIRLEFE